MFSNIQKPPQLYGRLFCFTFMAKETIVVPKYLAQRIAEGEHQMLDFKYAVNDACAAQALAGEFGCGHFQNTGHGTRRVIGAGGGLASAGGFVVGRMY